MVCLQLVGGKLYIEKAAETSSTRLKYRMKSIKITNPFEKANVFCKVKYHFKS